MAGALDRPIYTPQPPGTAGGATVDQWAYREFQVLSQALNKPPGWYLDVVTSPPTRPRDGLLAFADGVNWNPGEGKGLYVYAAGAWQMCVMNNVGMVGIGAPPGHDINFYLDKSLSGNTSQIIGQTGGLNRWAIVMGDATPESGGNAGSNFKIERFTDAGVLIDSPIAINRATGQVSINNAALNMGAWTAYTPLVGAGAGTITTASAGGRYLQLGKLMAVNLSVSITTNGTGSSYVTASLPGPSSGIGTVFAGRETNLTGKMLQGVISAGSASLIILNYDNTYPGANGAGFVLGGVYETV